MKTAVLTGGNHAGKTEVWKQLKTKGYPTIDESVHYYVDLMNRAHWKLNPENSQIDYTDSIKLRVEHYPEVSLGVAYGVAMIEQKELPTLTGDWAILDRGVWDHIAAGEMRGGEYPAVTDALLGNRTYDLVFALETVQPFDERKEKGKTLSLQDSLDLFKRCVDAYLKRDHEVIIVPQMNSAQERAEYIDSILQDR